MRVGEFESFFNQYLKQVKALLRSLPLVDNSVWSSPKMMYNEVKQYEPHDLWKQLNGNVNLTILIFSRTITAIPCFPIYYLLGTCFHFSLPLQIGIRPLHRVTPPFRSQTSGILDVNA